MDEREMREQVLQRVAEEAARLVADEDEELPHAKQRAAERLAASAGRAAGALPDDARVADALRTLLYARDGAAQVRRLQEGRRLALAWMERLEAHAPHLAGALLDGSATAAARLELELYTDDAKSVELALLALGVDFRVGPPPAGMTHALECIGCSAQPRGAGPQLLITVFDPRALRRASPRAARAGEPPRHPVETAGRANVAMVRTLLQAAEVEHA